MYGCGSIASDYLDTDTNEQKRTTMNDLQKSTVSVLNSLIEANENGRLGYQQASENVQEPTLRSTFGQFSQQHASFAEELRSEVRALGGDPEGREGSIGGSIFRGWISLKDALSSHDAEAVLEECERGEERAVEQYEDALGSELPANVRSLVERQCNSLRETKSRISALETRFDDDAWA